MLSGAKKEILDLVKRTGILSINEATRQIGLSKTTLREHLLQLERDGYIRRTYERTGPGRPSLKYQLTRHGHSLYPSGESDLIRSLLKHLKEKDQESLIETFFEQFWEKRLQSAIRLMNEANERSCSRTDALIQMLEEEGFMPEYEQISNDEIIIRACNCPYQKVIRETQLPCKMEAAFYERLFDADVQRTTYIADGDFSCTYCIRPRSV